ncbi:FtsJ-like methyltransferase-domain-containing protein [Aspergillus aurantiobrunneus]
MTPSIFTGLGNRINSTCRVQRFLQKRLSSSKRWQARQLKDHFTREAAVQGLKSRAAFKLLQIDEKYRVFKSGQTVVDLGYAPGSWSQVALTRTRPSGRVLGVDIIPSQPPKGVSSIQGNFLDSEVQAYVRDFVRNPWRGRPHAQGVNRDVDGLEGTAESVLEASPAGDGLGDRETCDSYDSHSNCQRTVDVVLSDMSAPWYQTTGFWKRSLSNPYNRMMNTSGLTFKDHAGSMDLCRAALEFSYEVLKAGGHFVCKYYQGAEDKDLEKQLKALFQRVHRIKPESSRSVCNMLISVQYLESKEAYFIGLDRKPHVRKQEALMVP